MQTKTSKGFIYKALWHRTAALYPSLQLVTQHSVDKEFVHIPTQWLYKTPYLFLNHHLPYSLATLATLTHRTSLPHSGVSLRFTVRSLNLSLIHI